ncbi:MAG: TonB-dependent receptor [Terriglobia bacterium]
MTGTHSNRNFAAVRLASLAIVALICVAAFPAGGAAQVLYSTIVGTVKDPSGAAVPGAAVTVTQEQTNLTRTAVTNSSGGYTVSTLPSGTYTVKVSAHGFKTFARSSVEVPYNFTARVDATLELGAVNQTVNVTSAAPLLQTDRADVHSNLSEQEVENVPMAPGNNFEQLFRAVPGISPPESSHSIPTNPSRALAFSSNGTGDYGNSIKIDGVTQWNIWVPEDTAYIPSSDSIQTVNITTGNFNTNEGFAGGSSANVEIKSGTNQFHGDVYEYHYDQAMEALEFFAPHDHITRSPKDIFNQFGGSVGGPIKKNKLFFFSNVELTREYAFSSKDQTIASPAMMKGDLRGLVGSIPGATAVNPDVVYDPATGKSDGSGRTQIFATNNSSDPRTYNAVCMPGQTGDVTLSSGFTECPNVIPTNRISPVANALDALLPQQNLPNSSSNVPDNNFIGSADTHFNRITTDNKINWNATNKFTMFGHIGYLNYGTLDPQVFGPVGGEEIDSSFIGNEGMGGGHTLTTSITGNYVATPNFVIEGNFGFTRQVSNSQQLDLATKEGQTLKWTNAAGVAGTGIPGANGTRFFEGSWPTFKIGSFSTLGTYNGYMPYFRNDPQFVWSGSANWIHGRHTLNFGGAFMDQHLNQTQPEWNAGGTSWPAAGGFDFTSGPTECKGCVASGKTTSGNAYNDFASFLLGVSSGWGRNIMVPNEFHTVTHMFALYAGDTWQVRPKLTATYGVRWEYYPFPTRSGTPAGVERYDFATGQMLNCGEGGNSISCGTTVSQKYFSPRIGLAYRATNTTVVRAGYGIAYEPFNLIDDLRTNYPILIPLNEGSPNSLLAAGVMNPQDFQNTPGGECAKYASYCFGAGGTLPVGIVPPSPLPSLTTASNAIPGNVNLVTAGNSAPRGYVQSWNFTIQKELPGNWVAQAGYVATRTVGQEGILDLNVQSPIGPAGCTPGKCGGSASQPFNSLSSTKGACTSSASTALGCRTGGTSIITPITEAHYDSLQATLGHRFNNGLEVDLAYTWSKTIGEAIHGGGQLGNDQKSSPYIQTPAFFNLNRGLAPWDRPQNFEAVFVWQPFFGPGKRFARTGISSEILGGWQLSGIFSSFSQTPVGELNAGSSSLNASGNEQRPNRLCSNITKIEQVGYGENWFDPSCFGGVDTQNFGNSAFYIFHGPHIDNLDAALFRNFKLSERFNLQFRAQAFNATNTPAFSNPSAGCGNVTSATDPVCNSTSFGQVRGTTNFGRHGNDFRQFEFNARLSF